MIKTSRKQIPPQVSSNEITLAWETVGLQKAGSNTIDIYDNATTDLGGNQTYTEPKNKTTTPHLTDDGAFTPRQKTAGFGLNSKINLWDA